MRIIVVDDEPLMLDLMSELINEVSPESEIRSFSNPLEVLPALKEKPADVAFLDICMGSVTGIDLAKDIKFCYPSTNIVFATSYDQYALDAFSVNASGYLLKPVSKDSIVSALQNLRYKPVSTPSGKLFFRCFGNFEAFCNGKPLEFQHEKTRELLAYLVDRHGAVCSNNEIVSALWDDDNHSSYLKVLRKDLTDTLSEVGFGEVIVKQWGAMGIAVSDDVHCDYYDWIDGKSDAVLSYSGEYMSQYSWAEMTNAGLMDF